MTKKKGDFNFLQNGSKRNDTTLPTFNSHDLQAEAARMSECLLNFYDVLSITEIV